MVLSSQINHGITYNAENTAKIKIKGQIIGL